MLDAEDAKLVTLARSARARTGAPQGAAVRDVDGRTYAASSVELAALRLSAAQVAVAMAVSSGARSLEAAVILGDGDGDGVVDPVSLAALHELGPSLTIHVGHPDGTITATL
jgi:cytidine deaminase